MLKKLLIISISTCVSIINATEYHYILKNLDITQSSQSSQSCVTPSSGLTGEFSNICGTEDSSFEGKNLFVLNGKIFELEEVLPMHAFSCYGRHPINTDNSYATDAEAELLAQLNNVNVYTPLGSFYGVASSFTLSHVQGDARAVRPNGSRFTNLMYRTYSDNGTINITQHPVLGNEMKLRPTYSIFPTGTAIKYRNSFAWGGIVNPFNANNFNTRACVVHLD